MEVPLASKLARFRNPIGALLGNTICEASMIRVVVKFLLVPFLLTACTVSGISDNLDELSWQCPNVPDNFTSDQLFGVWKSVYGASTDTLVLSEDGSYEQSFHRQTDDYSFSNIDNEWWLEERESGGYYLHLISMRRCDNTDELCEDILGGGGEYSYWDFCEDRFVEMQGEVILLVTGLPSGVDPTPREIWLWHMSPNPGSGSYHFILLTD